MFKFLEALKEKNWKTFYKQALIIFAFGAVYLWFWKAIAYSLFVPSSSMEPTMKPGDVWYSSRLDIDEFERFDIVCFEKNDMYLTKRIIGLPGEKVRVSNGSVYINGKKIKEDFIKEPMDIQGDGEWKVPKDSYFMMGDNRNDSYDSRFWDNPFVKKNTIYAKVKFLFVPFWRIPAQ